MQIDGEKWKQWQILFSWTPKSLQTVTAAMKRCLLLGRKGMTNLNSTLKSRDITLPTKVCIVISMAFPVVMYRWEPDHKEGWAPKNWYFWTVVLEKTLESPLDSKEIKPVNPKGNQSWMFIDWKDWCWSWSSNTLATWCEEVTHWKRSWFWERLRAEGEGGDQGWDGDSMDMSWSKPQDIVKYRKVWRAAVHGIAKSRTWLSHLTTTTTTKVESWRN